MNLHKEIHFEVEVCEYLSAHGWLYAEADAASYDRALAVFPADVLTWAQEAQPKAWDALTKNHGAQAGDVMLARLREQVNGGAYKPWRHHLRGVYCDSQSEDAGTVWPQTQS